MISTHIIFCDKDFAIVQYLPLFAIQPCPANFPRPPALMGHYPYFFDFKTDEVPAKTGIAVHSYNLGEKPKIEDFQKIPADARLAREDEKKRVKNEILYLVNALSNDYFFSYGSKQNWSINMSDERTMGDRLSWGQEGYLAPDFTRELDEVEGVANAAKSAPVLDPPLQTYRDKETNELKYEVRLSDLFELYYSCDDSEFKDKFLNACIVYSKSRKLWEVDQSASFIFLVSTVEALVEIEYKDVPVETCSECNQPRYRVVKKFHDFVDKYCYEIDKKTKDLFYGIRSKVVHSGALMPLSYDDHTWVIETQEDLDKMYYRSMSRLHHESLQRLVQTCLRGFLYQKLTQP